MLVLIQARKLNIRYYTFIGDTTHTANLHIIHMKKITKLK